MDAIQKFKSEIESKISTISNALGKVDAIKSLSPVISKLDGDNFWDLTYDDLDLINNNLKNENQLNEIELDFLKTFIGLDSNLKQFIKNQIHLDDVQRNLFLEIKRKIKNAKDNLMSFNINDLQQELIKYKSLLSKLNNNDIQLISDFDLIEKIIDSDAFDLKEKFEILKYINSINVSVYSNYNIVIDNNVEDDEIILSEDDLVESNLEFEKLKGLFDVFGIDWNKILYNKNEKEKMILEKELNYYEKKLLKYGDYDKMYSMLTFINDKGLTFIYDLPEILTKTLLYTTIEQLNAFINEVTENGLDYHVVLKYQPSNFIPPIFEKRKVRGTTGGNNDKKNVTGSLNNFMKTINFLNENGFPVEEVYRDCPSLFVRKSETARKIYDKLRMYGISLWYPNGRIKNAFSVLHTYDVLDRLDVAIECGCYEYISNNITKLVDPKFNMYKVKFAKKENIPDEKIFRIMKSKGNDVIVMRKNIETEKKIDFGNTIEDTFRLYNADNFDGYIEEENRRFYDVVINNSQNDTISDISLNDSLISQLEKYRVINNDLIYNFNGVIISRLKVLRLYQTLISEQNIIPNREALFYAIVRNSMLNKEEIENINKCLDNIKFKRRDLV